MGNIVSIFRCQPFSKYGTWHQQGQGTAHDVLGLCGVGLSGTQFSRVSREDWQAKVRDEALHYFNKKMEFAAASKLRSDRLRLKQYFSGSRVRDWTGLGGYWVGVKIIMDEIRRQLGGEDGV